MTGNRFSTVILVDARGWLLLQERDEFPEVDPEKWGLVGGHLEEGEGFEEGAYRELEEETGLRLPPGALEQWGVFRPWEGGPGGDDPMAVWVARADLADADIDCQEGRQIVFVDPDTLPELDLGGAPSVLLPEFLRSSAYAGLTR